jgi:hypothetical protein
MLNIISRTVFYLKHDVSEIGCCLRLQVDPIYLGPIEIISVSGLNMYHLKKETIQSPKRGVSNKIRHDR